MKLSSSVATISCLVVAGLGLLYSSQAAAVDAAAAESLARRSGCFKCHAVDKKKEGTPYKEVSAKYKGKADAEAKITKHITTGEQVKFEDGHTEDHTIIKTKDPAEIKNVVQWILSL